MSRTIFVCGRGAGKSWRANWVESWLVASAWSGILRRFTPDGVFDETWAGGKIIEIRKLPKKTVGNGVKFTTMGCSK